MGKQIGGLLGMPEEDKGAKRARKKELARQKAEAQRLDQRKSRLDDMGQRRGVGQGAFMRTNERGILARVLGG